MTTYLLDSNALIALSIEEHEHHTRVARWAATEKQLAICPIVEGALIRFFVRTGERVSSSLDLLRAIRSEERMSFWPENLSYADCPMTHVHGHRQVTDAYLAALAAGRRDARLATLDEALAADCPATAVLIPR